MDESAENGEDWIGARVRALDELAERTRMQTLSAYGLEPWEMGAAPVPLRVRVWRAVTLARRRGKVIDWRAYNAAEADAKAAEAAFVAGLPGRMQEIADHFSAVLPDGMRFEWVTDDD